MGVADRGTRRGWGEGGEACVWLCGTHLALLDLRAAAHRRVPLRQLRHADKRAVHDRAADGAVEAAVAQRLFVSFITSKASSKTIGMCAVSSSLHAARSKRRLAETPAIDGSL